LLSPALREVAAYVDAHAGEVDQAGHRLVVRNGYHQPREVATAAGAVPVRAPRVNDRRLDEASGQRLRFSSAILPAWARKSPQVAGLTPILLAVSDNGSQLIARDTRKFMAMLAIAQHFGRPSTPTDQAWIEALNGTIKGECPHLLAITDPAVLRAELELVRTEYNTVRLHSGVGYVTPQDEHTGRGEAIRSARRQGLHQARTRRLAHHRRHRDDQ